MTNQEFQSIIKAVVSALRTELTPDNKDVLDKLSVDDNKLKYDDSYVAHNYVTTESSPIGEIISYMGNTAPEHYLICDGAEYTIDTYPLLEKHFVDQFGSVNFFGGDGETTFKVPDLRGEFLRGTGTNTKAQQGSGADVGVHQFGTKHIYSAVEINQQDPYVLYADSSINSYCDLKPDRVDYSITSLNTSRTKFIPGGLRTITGTSKTNIKYYTSRPNNTAVLYCIKYE